MKMKSCARDLTETYELDYTTCLTRSLKKNAFEKYVQLVGVKFGWLFVTLSLKS